MTACWRRDRLIRAVLALALLASLALPPALFAASVAADVGGDDSLPIGLTPEEEGMLDRIGEAHRTTRPATGPIRNPGEFEPMTGAIVRYPFGNPASLMAEYSQDVTLWVIVEDTDDQDAASSILSSGGANMSNVAWVFAPTNSYWTRDYGPWFIIDGDGGQGIVDHVYNRPRPLDDVIPAIIGGDWGIPVYGMDLETTGGNYMSDGLGTGMSTRLVIDENTDLLVSEIDSLMQAYLGIERYEKLPYIQTGGIHHIDCWAKFLSPEKILVREVPPSHTDYARIEANVAYLSTLSNAYGRPYDIVRVYTPSNEPYTNSLILNDKVFVPMYGTSWDDDALQTYRDAMPGYNVMGYSGSWLSDDAIHCRVMGVTDRYMLYIDHVPLGDSPDTINGYRVEAAIHDYSGAGLESDSLLVYWKVDDDPDFTPIVMTEDSRAGTYYADIPAQDLGSEVSYYIYAVDYSGRHEAHPYVAPGDFHSFEIVIDTEPPVIVHTPIEDITAGHWPPTVEAQVTDNTVVGAVTLESSINGTPQEDVTLSRVGSTAYYEGEFPGSAVAGDAVTYRIKAEDAASPPNVSYDPPSGTHSFDVLDAIDVVVWEPDPSPLSGPAITSLLTTMDVSYDYVTGYTMPNLGDYSAAFICLGIYPNNYALTEAQANALIGYLGDGVHVYMEGGDCWAYDSVRTIYNGHFGINGQSDGSGDLSTVQGESGTMTEGMSFAYAGGNSYIDHIAATGDAIRIFRNPADGAGCGVTNDPGTYKTVGCAFEFGGLVDGVEPSTKEELLADILGFFGILQTGVDDAPQVFTFRLEQNHPNPFNPTTSIAFELPSRESVELAVYSAAGRRVATLVQGRVEAGRHTITWRGVDDSGAPVASGVYFFRLRRDGETAMRKGVLLK
jgi:agmatine deiminase